MLKIRIEYTTDTINQETVHASETLTMEDKQVYLEELDLYNSTIWFNIRLVLMRVFKTGKEKAK